MLRPRVRSRFGSGSRSFRREHLPSDFEKNAGDMGGIGSGRRSTGAPRRYVDECPWIDILELHHRGLLHPTSGAKFSCSLVLVGGVHDGDTAWCVNGRVELDTVVLSNSVVAESEDQGPLEQRVHLEWTQCRFGGRRPWLLCPGRRTAQEPCGRRVTRLYETARSFVCRRCNSLPYRSQWEDADTRLLTRAQRVRVRLGGAPFIGRPFPPRPKGMHRTTYFRLLRIDRSANEVIRRRVAKTKREIRGWRRRLKKLKRLCRAQNSRSLGQRSIKEKGD